MEDADRSVTIQFTNSHLGVVGGLGSSPRRLGIDGPVEGKVHTFSGGARKLVWWRVGGRKHPELNELAKRRADERFAAWKAQNDQDNS